MMIQGKRRLAIALSALAATGLGGGAAIAASGPGDVTSANTPRAVKGDVIRADHAGTAKAQLVKKDPRRANGAVVAAGKAGDVQGQIERASTPGHDSRPAPAP